jgi:hypothetical protein
MKAKGGMFYGRRIKRPGAPSKRHGARKVYQEHPVDSKHPRRRCACYYAMPCPRKAVGHE